MKPAGGKGCPASPELEDEAALVWPAGGGILKIIVTKQLLHGFALLELVTFKKKY